jgi:plasmid stabilization system protein ParE
MSGYALHPEAYRDLDEIWEFIALDNINAAVCGLASFAAALALWPQFLGAGKNPSENP